MTIRCMTAADLDFCVERVTGEGWLSETRTVFEASLAYDAGGCFVAEMDGRRVGMCVATAYDDCGFLGELIVVPERRGHGLGRRLMTHAIEYLRSRGCASIYLDGDLPAVPLYERLGFRVAGRSLRFLGSVDPVSSPAVRPTLPSDLDLLCELDRVAFGADRSFFLRYRFERFPELCHTLVARGRAAGFIMAAPGRDIVTVGPWLVPEDEADAPAMLGVLTSRRVKSKLRIGILESHRRAAEKFRDLGSFHETEPSYRMVLGPDLGLGDSCCLWAIGAPAKG